MSGKPITNVRVTDISDPCGGRIKRAAEWCSENDGIEASYVYKASLMGRSPTLFLSDAEGPICIAEASPYNSRSEKLYEIALTEEESAQKEYELEGEFTFLCGEWAGNFWHWFTEFLPYVVYLEGRGYKGKYLVWNYAPLFYRKPCVVRRRTRSDCPL